MSIHANISGDYNTTDRSTQQESLLIQTGAGDARIGGVPVPVLNEKFDDPTVLAMEQSFVNTLSKTE